MDKIEKGTYMTKQNINNSSVSKGISLNSTSVSEGRRADEGCPPAQPAVCNVCTNLLEGDTLYRMSDWDGGIGFDYIRNIQFCPICGRKLSKD